MTENIIIFQLASQHLVSNGKKVTISQSISKNITTIMVRSFSYQILYKRLLIVIDTTGELGYDRLNGTRKIGPSYAKSVIYI